MSSAYFIYYIGYSWSIVTGQDNYARRKPRLWSSAGLHSLPVVLVWVSWVSWLVWLVWLLAKEKKKPTSTYLMES